MKATKIAVTSNGNNVDDYARALTKFGFRLDGDKYVKTIHSKQEINKIKTFCRSNRLKFYIDNEYGVRSTTYRSEYFKVHSANRHGKYRCVYCGRFYTKEKITIDHLYPVDKVSKDIKLQKRLKKQGIESLNSTNNLVAACQSCNRRKSNKMGKWIWKGCLGQSEGLWKIRKGIRILIFLALLYVILCMFIPSIIPENWTFLSQTLPPIGNAIKKIFGVF